MTQIIVHNCTRDSWNLLLQRNTLSSNIFLECHLNENVKLFASNLNIVQDHFPYTIHTYSFNENITELITELNAYKFISISQCCCNYIPEDFTKLIKTMTENTLFEVHPVYDTTPENIKQIWDKKIITKKIKKKRYYC